MGEDKLNSDNEKRQNKKPTQQNPNKEYEKKIIDDIINGNSSIKQSVEEIMGAIGNSGGSTTDTTGTTSNNESCTNLDIKSLTDNVVNINILRFELDRLPLDFRSRAYFENDVKPLSDTLTQLSFASDNFSIAAANMANTNFGHASKIKDALDLVVDVNEIAEDIIGVLRCKIDNMLKLARYDCDCK